MNDKDLFAEMMANAMLYGVGVLTMTHKEGGDLDIRVVPMEEYTELGESLAWIAQNTKASK